MKRRYVITLLSSLVLGIIITVLFTAQMSWKTMGDCANLRQPLPNSIRKVECAGMTYGFPLRFIESKPYVEFDQLGEVPSLATLSASATTSLDAPKLALNILFWTALCATLGIFTLHKTSKKPANPEPATESPKK